jgi:hypothetical protein
MAAGRTSSSTRPDGHGPNRVRSGVHYAFTSDASRNDWGYRFTVRALHRPPLTPDADARLAVACAVVDAALAHPARAPALAGRAWLEAVAGACCAADGARQRGLLGCLARLAARAADVPDHALPGDEVFAPVAAALVRAVDERRAAGERVGSPDTLAHALALSAWCVAAPAAAARRCRVRACGGRCRERVRRGQASAPRGLARPDAGPGRAGPSEARLERGETGRYPTEAPPLQTLLADPSSESFRSPTGRRSRCRERCASALRVRRVRQQRGTRHGAVWGGG